jgi:hypothetical protein
VNQDSARLTYLYARPSAENHKHDRQNQTNDKGYPCNFDGDAGDAGETQYAGDNGDNQKCGCVSYHVYLLYSVFGTVYSVIVAKVDVAFFVCASGAAPVLH